MVEFVKVRIALIHSPEAGDELERLIAQGFRIVACTTDGTMLYFVVQK